MDSDNYELMLNLPDGVLLDVIFPKLPVDILGKICSMNVRFNTLCQNDKLWLNKTLNDYPTAV